MTSASVLFKDLTFSAGGGQMWLDTRASTRLRVEFLHDDGVLEALFICYSFCGRSAVVGYIAVEGVEQLPERAWRLVHQ